MDGILVLIVFLRIENVLAEHWGQRVLLSRYLRIDEDCGASAEQGGLERYGSNGERGATSDVGRLVGEPS